MPVESELERGARMKSVGILCPSYTLLYRYMHFLENQVRSDMSCLYLSILAPVVHPVCAQRSIFIAVMCPPPFVVVVGFFVGPSIKHEPQLQLQSQKLVTHAALVSSGSTEADEALTASPAFANPAALSCSSHAKPHILHTRVPQLVRFLPNEAK